MDQSIIRVHFVVLFSFVTNLLFFFLFLFSFSFSCNCWFALCFSCIEQPFCIYDILQIHFIHNYDSVSLSFDGFFFYNYLHVYSPVCPCFSGNFLLIWKTCQMTKNSTSLLFACRSAKLHLN